MSIQEEALEEALRLRDDFEAAPEKTQRVVDKLMRIHMAGDKLEDFAIISAIMVITAELGNLNKRHEALRAAYTAMVGEIE